MGLMTAVLAVLVVLALIVVSLCNKLVRIRATVESAWSDIDVQLKKRYDLVPNLVETVKGYASHEQALFTKVTESRTQAMRASGPAETASAQNLLRDSLKSLFAIAEVYPDLKEIEDAVEAARRYCNAVVRDLNTMVEQFPSNLVAARFEFEKKEFFELETPALERRAVPVRF